MSNAANLRTLTASRSWTQRAPRRAAPLALFVASALGLAGALAAAGRADAATAPPSPPAPPPANPAPPATFPDPSGQWTNFSVAGALDLDSPFFQGLGTNGRSCATCHGAKDAWTATPPQLRQRFAATGGNDPVFASVDGTNCPSLEVATPAARQAASSLLLSKGLIRVALSPPAGADFTVASVDNPYGCASTSTLSVYRRILPATNLAFLSTVMWDGRETLAGHGITADLIAQATSAVQTHEAAVKLPAAAVLDAIESFEVEQFTAQSADTHAGPLNAAGATGGPLHLAEQAYTPGINDPFGHAAVQPGIPPNPVFTVFTSWETLNQTSAVSPAQASIGRGERIFNTRPMAITGVAGINDQVGSNGRLMSTVTGTCGTCHNAPNAGSHSTPLLVNIGIAAGARRSADLPLFTLVNRSTGATVETSDPGLALSTGRWTDVGKFKIPTLRALAARAPYFHDGSGATLDDVVNFYNQRFNLNLLPQEHADLVAFLSAL